MGCNILDKNEAADGNLAACLPEVAAFVLQWTVWTTWLGLKPMLMHFQFLLVLLKWETPAQVALFAPPQQEEPGSLWRALGLAVWWQMSGRVEELLEQFGSNPPPVPLRLLRAEMMPSRPPSQAEFGLTTEGKMEMTLVSAATLKNKQKRKKRNRIMQIWLLKAGISCRNVFLLKTFHSHFWKLLRDSIYPLKS